MGNELGVLIRADLDRIEADLSSIAPSGISAPPTAWHGGADAGVSFADAMKEAVHGVDAKEQAASDKLAAVDSGRSDDLVGAMLASQEASLSFSMLMQVRNKVVGAFDELIRLQL
ncbi:MAG: flagellar hook-basal body complex protein FliE [Rhodocyclaceae bacterium]|nr:flagellar hook-basal body complex protein FliE [Rhodocyclaceae bacterium]